MLVVIRDMPSRDSSSIVDSALGFQLGYCLDHLSMHHQLDRTSSSTSRAAVPCFPRSPVLPPALLIHLLEYLRPE